jgi:hypothetical protein
MEVSTATVTVNVAEPLIAPEMAEMVAAPGATLVARPVLLTVETEGDEEVQAAVVVRFCVVPLL